MKQQAMDKDKKLEKLGIFSTQDAVNAGISQPTLSRLVKAEKLIRLEHGLFLHPEAKIDLSELDFAIACAKLGKKSVIGGLSALFRYGLISQVPDQIWILVPVSVKSNNPLYRCIRTKLNLTLGVVNSRFYRITNIERTLIEALNYSTKIGASLAVGAVRKAIEEGKTTEKKLYEMAKLLGAEKVFSKYWEVIVTI